MSVELLKSIFDWGSVFLFAFAFLFGAGALKTGAILANRQAERSKQVEIELGNQKERADQMEAANLQLKIDLQTAEKSAAEAQLALKRELEVVEKARSFRNIDREKFFKYIKGAPKRRVVVTYHANDSEAYWFASQIRYVLGQGIKGEGAGWDVTEPSPIAFKGGPERLANDPTKLEYGNINQGIGIAIVAKEQFKAGTDDQLAYQALSSAIGFSLGRPAVPIAVRQDSTLPEGTFVVVVGQKD